MPKKASRERRSLIVGLTCQRSRRCQSKSDYYVPTREPNVRTIVRRICVVMCVLDLTALNSCARAEVHLCTLRTGRYVLAARSLPGRLPPQPWPCERTNPWLSMSFFFFFKQKTAYEI